VNLLVLFWLFLKASLFSTGGIGNLPSLHADLLARRWATERQFAEALLVGQISPGPNGLWVICLGYLIGGVRGSVLALAAITLPPMLVLFFERLYRRVSDHAAVEGFMRGLGLSVIGIAMVVLAGLMREAGLNPRSFTVAAGSIALGATRRVPLGVIIALAAVVGVMAR
jgi:chromate transporter